MRNRARAGTAATFALILACVRSVAAAQPSDPTYEIGSHDVLHVIVLGQDALSGDFTVGADGMMSYPFLGRLKAAGMSPAELERKLATLLADGYLKHPQVSISVKEFRSQRVYVSGEVQNPGPYGLRPDRSLLSLIKDIGEFSPQVGHEVIVIRAPAPAPPDSPTPPPPAAGDGSDPQAAPSPSPSPSPAPPARPLYPGEVPGSQVFRLSLREVRSGYPDKDLQLQVGDTVYFPKAAQVYVTGHVARPGPYRYEEGMTVFQALALAGSVTDRGSEGRVRVVRLVEGRKKSFKPKLSDVLLPEDTLHVPERFF